MQITLELPEDIMQELRSKWKESLALEAYRSHALTAAQLRRLLGFETRMQVDVFLKEHEVYDLTAADFGRIVKHFVSFGQERLSTELTLDSRRPRHVADQLPHPVRED